jgi:hypothetical protein
MKDEIARLLSGQKEPVFGGTDLETLEKKRRSWELLCEAEGKIQKLEAKLKKKEKELVKARGALEPIIKIAENVVFFLPYGQDRENKIAQIEKAKSAIQPEKGERE